MPSQIRVYPVNRVEGDLELRIAVEDHRVTDAWSAGIMYRGFENLLVGRAALDGLVLTPRICGICSTSHLMAAARALDMIYHARLPDNAVRVRNVTLMAEKIQNDMRHAVLLFMTDFTHPAYRRLPIHQEAVRRYRPLAGESARDVVRETKRLIEIIAILGGQWPHSSFMVPGGVVCVPTANDLTQCRFLLRHFRRWYERRVLGCSLERWQQVRSEGELRRWLEEDPAHAEGELGFFLRFAAAAGLEGLGIAGVDFLCFGSLDLPQETAVAPIGGTGTQLLPAGVIRDGRRYAFDQRHVTEDVSHAWFEGGGGHPFSGRTRPYASGSESGRYSWAKAPRYEGRPAETGPLAELLVAGDPLLTELAAGHGAGVFARQLARMVRPAVLIPAMERWLEETAACREEFYLDHRKKDAGQGCGLLEAPRGALGHWVRIREGKIVGYQVITPTAWNASPRDTDGRRGPIEEAVVGTEIRDLDNPVEVNHVVHSFDPCLVCTVHAIDGRRRAADAGGASR